MPHVDRHTTHYHESCGCAEARIAEMGLKLQNALLAFGGAHRLNEEKDARIAELEAALRFAHAHIDELCDAWERGAISEHDGKGGLRSNRNAAVEMKIREALKGEGHDEG